MSPERRREHHILAAACVLAIAVPAAASTHLRSRLDHGLEARLSDALGTSVSIGRVEAGLTGSIRLEDVAIGSMFTARALEGSVALTSLLAGTIQADEIRIEQPRLRVHIDENGHSNLQRLVRSAARARARRQAEPSSTASGPQRAPRVLVSGGELLVDLGARGQLSLSGVELHPQVGGVRWVAGASSVDMHAASWTVSGRFARAAGDLSLPEASFDRLLAVGGELLVRPTRGNSTRLRRAALARRVGYDASVRFTAEVEQPGHDPRLTVIVPSLGADIVRVSATGDAVSLASLAPVVPAAIDLADARGTGRAEVQLHHDGRTDVLFDLQLARVRVDDRKVSRAPFEMNGQARLYASITQRGPHRQISFDTLELSSGDLDVKLAGHARWRPGDEIPAQGHVEGEMQRASCGGVLASLPLPLRDRLTGLRGRGTVGASARLAFDRDAPTTTHLEVDVDVSECRVRHEATDADPRVLTHPFLHRFPDGSTAKVGYGVSDYATLRSLPGHVMGAFVASEDTKFYEHHGFDTRQIERSLAVDIERGRFARGGSTISQQLVKNVFLTHERSLARKFQEAVLTWRLESHLGKRLILERYLNIIELGEGVFGVSAAARHWFGKPAQRLRVAEAAFLAALTPSPRTTSRRIRATGGLDRHTDQRVRSTLRHMWRAGVINEAAYRRALESGVTLSAAHLATR